MRKTILEDTVATGGVDVIVLFTCAVNYYWGVNTGTYAVFDLEYWRDNTKVHTMRIGPYGRSDKSTQMQFMYTDTGTTGTHTLAMKGHTYVGPRNSWLKVLDPKVSFIILKT